MEIENPVGLIRQLKGAPLSCLLAIALAGQPVGSTWLVRVTGYSDKPVKLALSYLQEIGLATSTGRYDSWQLTAGLQLPLGAGALPGSRNYSDSNATTTTLNIQNEKSRVLSSSSTPGSRNNSDSNANSNVIKLLKEMKVGEPTLSRLANLPHVTEEYLQAHIAAARAEKISTRLFIHRIQSGDIQPELPEEPEETGPEYARYISGTFADYIKH